MAIPTLNLRTTLDAIAIEIKANDLTDYAGAGINAADCRGYIKVQLETSEGTTTIYDNLGGVTPDINLSVSTQNTSTIPLPYESVTKAPLKGKYYITYEVYNVVALMGVATITYTYEYDFDYPEACIEVDVNCSASTITSRDETDYTIYMSTMTRTHTLYPPPASGASTLVAALQTIVYTNIYTTTWTAEISTDTTWILDNGLYVRGLVEGTKEFKVDCDTNLCKITCCLQDLYAEYNTLGITNPAKASIFKKNKIDPVTEYLVLFMVAQHCGDIDKLSEIKANIEKVSGCNDNCGCSTGKPVLVVPAVGSSNNIIVDSPDTSIDVVPQVVGSTTYFHIQVSAILQTIINNFSSGNNYIVDTDTPTWLTVTASGTNPKTYTITYIDNTTVHPNFIELYFTIDTPTRTLNQYTIMCYGDLVNKISSHGYFLYPNPPAATDYIVLKGQGMFNALPTEFTVKANVMNSYVKLTEPESILLISQLKTIEADVMWHSQSSGVFYIRLYSPVDGHILKYNELSVDTDSQTVGLCVQIIATNSNLIKTV